jgi:uncharacterized coiled-coil protein SlyX
LVDRIKTPLTDLEARLASLEQHVDQQENRIGEPNLASAYLQETPLRLLRLLLLTLYAHDPMLPIRQFMEIARKQELGVLTQSDLPTEVLELMQEKLEDFLMTALPTEEELDGFDKISREGNQCEP